MTPRSAQLLTAALAVLLVVLIGATIFVMLSRPNAGPTASPTALSSAAPSPSATAAAVVTASPSAAPASSAPTAEVTAPPTPSPSPSPTPEVTASPSPGVTDSPTPLITPSPTPSPTITPSPTPTLPPTPTPSPTPVISPTSPERQLRLRNVGLDAGSPRYVVINVDGPSIVSARLTDVSGGTTRVCIRREADNDTGDCKNRFVRWVVTETGSSTWKIEVIARPESIDPRATVTITFNANEPTATLNSFRYNGTSDESRNGYRAEFTTQADGEVAVRGNFEGNTFNYRLVVEPCPDPACDQTGSGQNFEAMLAGVAGTTYSVSVFSPDEATSEPAFVQSTLSWH